MPELPEVETIRMQLDKYIVGETIKKVEIRNKKYEFDTKNIIGQKIIRIRRFAKQLSIDLENKYSIMIHVKMTGQLLYQNANIKNQISPKVIGGLGGKHTHLIFHLSDGDLYYNDVRQFGWIRVIKNEEIIIKNYAPEPFGSAQGKPSRLTFKYFEKLLKNSRRNIKVLLMDQSKIGGVGNIYANDALWLAKIRPQRIANSVQIDEQKELYNAIHTVLKAGLKYGGASELAFVTPDGKEGEYQNHTLVYGRTGKLCLKCKNKIEKFFLGGRGTYICPKCQK